MAFSYTYSPYLWPLLGSIALILILGFHGFKHRSAPGAVPFIFLMAFSLIWVLANALIIAATGTSTKIFWFKVEKALILPLASAALCFALEYAGLIRKRFTWRMLAMLFALPLAFMLLVMTLLC